MAKFAYRLLAAGVGTLVVSFLAGCASSSEDKVEPIPRGVFAPRPPAFVNGALSLLLTNGESYTAHVVAAKEADKVISGDLFVRRGLVLFAPIPDPAMEKHLPNAGFTFVWDTVTAKGYFLSEALQAWAPFSARVTATGASAVPGQAAPQKISGLTCEPRNTTVQLSDGSALAFLAWRSAEFGNLAVRIDTFTNTAVPLLTLSKIRRQELSADIFEPPKGFTRYSSAEALVDELALRRHYQKRPKVEGYDIPMEPPGGPAQPAQQHR